MSTHYKNRQPSGCCGCAAALLISVGMLAVTGYVCYEFATWLVGL